jgi:hypothetical protein
LRQRQLQDRNEQRQGQDDNDAQDGGERDRRRDVVAVGANHRRHRGDRRIAADRIAAGNQDGHAQRQTEHPANDEARAERHGDDGSDADEQDRTKRQNRRDAHRGAEHDDRDLEQGFCRKRDAGDERLCRRPRRAEDDTEQDRKHQRFEISLTGEMNLDGLQQDRHDGDRDAEHDARQQAA